MGLFKPAWMSDNEEKAVRAVEKTTDLYTLIDIAKQGKGNLVLMKTVMKLGKIETFDKNKVKMINRAAELAIERITDQKILSVVVINCDYGSSFALKKIRDQRVIYDIAQSARGELLRIDAVKELSDQEMLSNIAKNNKESILRICAAEKLTDKALAQEVFADIAKKEETCRMRAIGNLTNQSVLEEIAGEAGTLPRSYQEKAIEMLIDQPALERIAQCDSVYLNIRLSAIEKITNQSVLADLARNSHDDLSVSLAAVDRLADQSALAEIAENSNYCFEIRSAAVGKLTDLPTLTILASVPSKEPIKYRRSAPSSADYISLCKCATERLIDLRNQSIIQKREEICKGEHNWKFIKREGRSYNDGAVQELYAIYKCQRCGKIQNDSGEFWSDD